MRFSVSRCTRYFYWGSSCEQVTEYDCVISTSGSFQNISALDSRARKRATAFHWRFPGNFPFLLDNLQRITTLVSWRIFQSGITKTVQKYFRFFSFQFSLARVVFYFLFFPNTATHKQRFERYKMRFSGMGVQWERWKFGLPIILSRCLRFSVNDRWTHYWTSSFD